MINALSMSRTDCHPSHRPVSRAELPVVVQPYCLGGGRTEVVQREILNTVLLGVARKAVQVLSPVQIAVSENLMRSGFRNTYVSESGSSLVCSASYGIVVIPETRREIAVGSETHSRHGKAEQTFWRAANALS